MSESAKVQVVRCPKCHVLLTEPADYSVYQCGGCGAVLQGRKKVPQKRAGEEISSERLVTARGLDVNIAPADVDGADDAAKISSPKSEISSLDMDFGVVVSHGPGSYKRELVGNADRPSDDDENGSARKKLRLSVEQRAFLEDSFKEDATLNPKKKLALAKQLNLRPRQVEVWFQNRRARDGAEFIGDVQTVRLKLDDNRPLLDSNDKGLTVLDRARECSKSSERIVDCYMSPKTIWEGKKALHPERIKVGPFYVSNTVNERDLQLIQYVFEHLSGHYMVFLSSRSFLFQSRLTTLRPKTPLHWMVIDTFADILTDTERRKESKALNWYLPVIFSNAALNSLSSFLDVVQWPKMREKYMFGDLEYCEKIFIPVDVRRCEHYYLYIFHMKNQEVEIWDSLCDQFMDNVERNQITQKLLLALDKLFENVTFTKFRWRMANNILVQPNEYDGGIFVIKYMQQSDNYVRQNPLFQFDSDEERLNLALKLLKNDLNKKKETLYDKAAGRHHASLIRRKQDIFRTVSEDVAKGIYGEGELQKYSGNRVKRINVGLKPGCSKGCLLPTTDLVGDKFQSYTQQIWEWIMGDKVSAIGIWGMGGAGKTALATHVHNKLLDEADDKFDHIIWVTVSQCDNSIYTLQKEIAKSINLDISDERDVKKISGKLLQASKHKNRCVLVLDDVWDYIILEEVGFPVSNNGIKLILTTRSWQVCQSMNCMENIVKVEPLDEEEGWDLFKRTIGIDQIQSIEVEIITKAVVKQCEGLPLAIVTKARSMKGKEDISEWNHLLECLQNLDNEQYHMVNWVFPVLKSSYACLSNKLQSFFLYYALSAEKDADDGYLQPLFKRFFYEGWTHQTKGFEIQLEDGYTMLHELKNNSLLIEKNGQMRMHTLLRFMAINIAKETKEIMAKPGMNLIDLPENGDWKENLQKVFLTGSNIQKILDGTSPKCSKLSTLLLDCNYDLKWIPDDFFNNMPALKILDLSRTGIKYLPKSVSNLECLMALLLSGCEELSKVPSLEKLQQLIELDLSYTAITEAPCGLKLLVNLKCLNLEGGDQLKMSTSTISKITHLHSLRLLNWIPKSTDVRVQDLQGLRKLKVISVSFYDIEEFNAYVNSFLDQDCVLKSYFLRSATVLDPDSFVSALESCSVKRVGLCGIDLANTTALLPEDVNELIISKCDHRTRTCVGNTLSFCANNSDFPKIEWLQISECNKLEYLCCVSPTCLFCSSVQLVRRLSLIALKDLKQIVAPIAPFEDGQFLCLRDLQICKCSKMKVLIMPELLAQLKNLETISVESCKSMEEIVGENSCSRTITLPKLRSVALHDLPELTSVFKGTMQCPSLKDFHAYDCEKLVSSPDIEIMEGYKLHMKMEMSTGYNWECDNQDSEFDD